MPTDETPLPDRRRRKRSPNLTPSERSLRARIAAESMHAQGKTNTGPGTAAFLSRFEQMVDPEGVLDHAERSRRAEHARKAHFARLALASAKARRLKKAS